MNFSASGAPRVLVITGPTATGKTTLGVLAALELGGEVVSADSMQVYRGMDIGTAKPGPFELRGVPHHMLDVADPRENYSVARYVREASAHVDDILSRGLLPIIAGGTGLYIDSLIAGRDFAEGAGDGELRRRLGEDFDKLGAVAMLQQLAGFDPERAARLAPGDRRRIIRSIEIYLLTGKTATEHDEETRARAPRYRAAVIALNFRDRAVLYKRIDARVDDMLRRGLVSEVSSLLSAGVPRDSTAMQAIGYKEIASALFGEIPTEEAAESIKRESRRYAKRQLTWLRRRKDLGWIEWDDEPDFDFALHYSTKFIGSPVIE